MSLCYTGCGSQSDNEGINIPGTGKIPETKVADWRKLWQANQNESVQYMTGLFHCSWGCARDYIQGNKSGTILGFANEGTVAIMPTQVEAQVVEAEIDPMEQLIQGRLILIEVAISCQGVLTRCKNLTSDFEAAIRALKEVYKVADIKDNNEQLNERLNAAEHSLVAANSYIEELKARLGISS